MVVIKMNKENKLPYGIELQETLHNNGWGECPRELYDLTYDIIKYISKTDKIGLVLNMEDFIMSQLHFMDDEDTSTIKMVLPMGMYVELEMMFGELSSLNDLYVHTINGILDDPVVDNKLPIALVYIILLLHELGHFDKKMKMHGLECCNKLPEPGTLSADTMYMVDPDELYADLFAVSRLSETFKLFYTRAECIFINLNRRLNNLWVGDTNDEEI
jgi:hypothetical protein